MSLCLLLLTSTFLAIGQSTSPPSSSRSRAVQREQPEHVHIYANLLKKMEEFDKQYVAPLLTENGGNCDKNKKEQISEKVSPKGHDVELEKRRCENALVLTYLMDEIREEFDRQMEEIRAELEWQSGNNKVEDDQKSLGLMFRHIWYHIWKHDVDSLEQKLRVQLYHCQHELKVADPHHLNVDNPPDPKITELHEVILRAKDVGEDKEALKLRERKKLNEVFKQSVQAFKKNPSLETAYSMIFTASLMGELFTDYNNPEEELKWAMQQFVLNLKVYNFLHYYYLLKKEDWPVGIDTWAA